MTVVGTKSNHLYLYIIIKKYKAWMAPEMLRQEIYTEKVDVYSFSLVLYELV